MLSLPLSSKILSDKPLCRPVFGEADVLGWTGKCWGNFLANSFAFLFCTRKRGHEALEACSRCISFLPFQSQRTVCSTVTHFPASWNKETGKDLTREKQLDVQYCILVSLFRFNWVFGLIALPSQHNTQEVVRQNNYPTKFWQRPYGAFSYSVQWQCTCMQHNYVIWKHSPLMQELAALKAGVNIKLMCSNLNMCA